MQNKCARFACNDWRRTSSVSQMVASLGWESLQERRARARVTTMYNIINGNVDIPVTYVTPSPSPYLTRGSNLQFLIPHCNTNVYLNSFFPATIYFWNALPMSVTAAVSLNSFQERITAVCLTK